MKKEKERMNYKPRDYHTISSISDTTTKANIERDPVKKGELYLNIVREALKFTVVLLDRDDYAHGREYLMTAQTAATRLENHIPKLEDEGGREDEE